MHRTRRQHRRQRVHRGGRDREWREAHRGIDPQSPKVVPGPVQREVPECAIGRDVGGDRRAGHCRDSLRVSLGVEALQVGDARGLRRCIDGAAVEPPRGIVARDAVVGIGIPERAVHGRDARDAPAIARLLGDDDLPGAPRDARPVVVACHAAGTQELYAAGSEVHADKVAPAVIAPDRGGPVAIEGGIGVPERRVSRDAQHVARLGVPDEQVRTHRAIVEHDAPRHEESPAIREPSRRFVRGAVTREERHHRLARGRKEGAVQHVFRVARELLRAPPSASGVGLFGGAPHD